MHQHLQYFLALDHPVLRLNLRGAGPSRPRCRQQYHAGRTEDLRDALATLDPVLTTPGVVLVGFSLGGNMLLKFLAEYGADFPIVAGVSVSAPIDLGAASRRLMAPRNFAYQRFLLRQMKLEALAEGSALTAEERAAVARVRSIYDFDDRVVAPRNGFDGAEDYYRRCSARYFLAGIRTPTLILHARNDPWIPIDSYLAVDWEAHPSLVPVLSTSGGHVGFHDGASRIPWHLRCISQFLAERPVTGRRPPPTSTHR